MKRMTPRGEELLRAGREALRPNDADRDRVFQALLPRIGIGSGAGSVSAPSSAPAAATPGGAVATTSTLVKAVTIVVGLGVAGGGLFLASRATPGTPAAAAPATPPPAPPVPTNVPTNDIPANDSATSTVSSAPPSEPVKKHVVTSRGAESLAQEVAILSRASADLHAGRPEAALAALAEHQRKFPGGVLAEERTAAQAQAFCALGRAREARTALARLARIAPHSPHEARARKACESVLTEGE